MAIPASGTLTATGGGVEHLLVDSETATGSFQVKVDRRLMEAGDELELRIAVAPFSGETQVIEFTETFIQLLPEPLPAERGLVSVPFKSDSLFTVSLILHSATPRDFPWSVAAL